MNHARTSVWVLLPAAAACMLVGCAASDHTQLMQFLATANTPTGSEEYRVMPPDDLAITARPTEEFNGLRVRVGPDGKAQLPLIGNYMFADKTTTQIAAELTEGLLDYYEDVHVTVTIANYRSQRYFVWGEVERPGVYSFTGNDTLVSALSTARPTRMSRPQRITVIRGLEPLPNGEGVAVDQHGRIKNRTNKVTIDMIAIAEGADAPANFMLANNDVIFVPTHPLAKVGLGLQRLLFPIRPLVSTIQSPRDVADAASGDGVRAGY